MSGEEILAYVILCIIVITVIFMVGIHWLLWREDEGRGPLWQSKWIKIQVEKVEVISSGYLCLIKKYIYEEYYFFDRDDVKTIEYQPGQGLRRTLVIKKAALRKRGLL